MTFTLQIGNGTGSAPAISVVNFLSGSIWTGYVPAGNIFPAAGAVPQFKSYTLFTTNPGDYVNPNGSLASVTFNAGSAAVGNYTLKMTGTGDPDSDSQFTNGVGDPVSATFAAGGMERVEILYHALDFSSAITQCGLLITLFLFTRALHISWRSSTTGIALGFGIFAAIGLTTSAFHPAVGTYPRIILDVINMAAYQLCVMVWLGYLFLPERIAAHQPFPLQEADLALWDQELQKMVQR
jgi:hypothetical protein